MISGMYISNIWFGCVIFHTQPLNTLARERLFLTSDPSDPHLDSWGSTNEKEAQKGRRCHFQTIEFLFVRAFALAPEAR